MSSIGEYIKAERKRLVYHKKNLYFEPDCDISPDQMRLYAMEEFCQLSRRIIYDKYNGSDEACGNKEKIKELIRKRIEYMQ